MKKIILNTMQFRASIISCACSIIKPCVNLLNCVIPACEAVAGISLFCLLLTPCVATANPNLQTILSSIHSMQAKFKQNVYSEHQKLLQTYSGKVEFKKPNQFRWEVTKPDPSVLITNGKKLWNYDVDLEQVTVEDYNANREITPLSFILDDTSNLNKNFNITTTSSNCYKLTPTQENSNFANVTVCFKNNIITSVNILDHLGQNSVFEFSHVRNNLTISDNHFNFDPPVGVDIIGN